MIDKPEEKRPRGRPVGSLNKRSAEMIALAEASGEMPNDFLLKVARGEPIRHGKLDAETGEITYGIVMVAMDVRIEAAKAVIPYFVPKLATVEFTQAIGDEELDELIEQLTAQAGVVAAATRESETKQDSDGSTGRVRISAATASSVLGTVE